MHSLFKDPRPEAALILSDGTVLLGRSFGASVSNVAEVVFNTAMTGYQEVLTDPSYTGQIVTLTGAHVGNVGVNAQDREGGAAVHAAGLVVRDVPAVHSNFRSEKSLPDYLVEQGVPAIAGVDTRRLTRILRTKGAQAGVIVVARNGALTEDEIDAGRKAVAAWKGMAGQDLAKVVTCKAPYEWTEGAFSMKAADGRPGFVTPAELPVHVVAYDFGVKTNILRMLVERGMRVTVVPAQTPVEDVLAMNPDGVFLSNGPGDPAPCTYAIEAARDHREEDSAFRHLPRPPDHGARRRRQDAQDEVRPSWREPSRGGFALATRVHYEPEPWFCRGCKNASRQRRADTRIALRRFAAGL